MFKKILFALLAIVVVIVVGFYVFVQMSWNKTYDLPYPDLQASTDSAVIARGAYLVNGPAHCSTCHAGDYTDLIKADTGALSLLRGGAKFPLGPLGVVYPANLTPDPETGIGRYEDKEVFRMMRHAVKPNGMATITPMMPFFNMSDDDLIAVVSYLKSMEPIRNEVPEPEWTFMGKFVRSVSSTFQPVENPQVPSAAPPMAATLERGEYLARSVANCVGCHTPRDPETFEPIGAEFSGGMEMEPFSEMNEMLGVDPNLWMRTPNLTPHPDGALAKYPTLESWIAKFRNGRIYPTSPMQWGPFAKMSDEDLEALYIFLNSLEPVENDVGEITFVKETN